jgi:transcriptional regulator with XRE-family HTH domain
LRQIELLTVPNEDTIRWPSQWDTEATRAMRHPRRAGHWFASRRQRRERVTALCSELEALIARRIRSERVAAGLRQIDLAEAIGVTQATISRLESGKSPASFADVVRIAIQLRLPLDHFFTPPGKARKTGWERHPTAPLIPWELEQAAREGELPIDHPMYD